MAKKPRPCLTRGCPGKAGRIKKAGSADEWAVYDSRGNYLGRTQDRAQALAMKKSGRTNNPAVDPGCHLELWEFWNAQVIADATVWEAPDGRQIVATCTNGVYIVAWREPDGSGYDAELRLYGDIQQAYYNDSTGIYDLTVAEKPLLLE